MPKIIKINFIDVIAVVINCSELAPLVILVQIRLSQLMKKTRVI